MGAAGSPAPGGDMGVPAMVAATALRDSSATESAAAEALARLLTAREPALTEKLTAGGSAIAAPQDAVAITQRTQGWMIIHMDKKEPYSVIAGKVRRLSTHSCPQRCDIATRSAQSALPLVPAVVVAGPRAPAVVATLWLQASSSLHPK